MASSKNDLEKADVSQVLGQLKVDAAKGLSSAEVKRSLTQFGPNTI